MSKRPTNTDIFNSLLDLHEKFGNADAKLDVVLDQQKGHDRRIGRTERGLVKVTVTLGVVIGVGAYLATLLIDVLKS